MVNPLYAYVVSWLLVLFLYSLNLTTNLVEMSPIGSTMIAMNLLSICVLYLLLGCNRGNQKIRLTNENAFTPTIILFLKRISMIWLLVTLIEIFYCNGFPLYWRLVGISKNYTEFGIPSLHGVMNACYLQVITMLSYLLFKTHQKKYFFYIIILLFWPVLMLGRGILLSALIQMACIYLMLTRLNILRIIALTGLTFLVILVFGYLGDLRQTTNPLSYLVREDALTLFDKLPSGFLWFYVYLTAGLSNLFHNVETIVPTYNFTYSFSNMLPSAIKNYFDIASVNGSLELVDISLNTSTNYVGFVSDFGPLGGFFFVAIIQFICCYCYLIALRGKPWGLFAYSVAFQVIIFSVFYDMFFLLPILFQWVICFTFYLYYARNIALNRQSIITGHEYAQ